MVSDTNVAPVLGCSPVRYAKFESIRYFIDIDILQNCLIDIDIFQNHHIDIDIDIDIFGITLSISISISIFFRIALSITISISIFSTFPYRYLYIYIYIDIDIFQKCRYIDNRYVISIYRTGLHCHLEPGQDCFITPLGGIRGGPQLRGGPI